MANTWKRAHGAKVSIGGATAVEDCTVIGIPGENYDLIEKPSLEDTRKDYDLSDTPDSEEIGITMPYVSGWTSLVTGATPVAIEIELPKVSATAKVAFNAIVTADQPGNAEVGGLLSREVTLKPTSAAVFTA